jgi:two-component system LytT family sensor kinase
MNWKKLGIHVALWAGLYVVWILLFQNRSLVWSRTVTTGLCYVVFIMFAYYLIVGIAIPRFLYKKNYSLFTLCFLGSIALSALGRVPVAMYMHRGEHLRWAPVFVESLLNIFIWVLCLVSGKLILDRMRFQHYVDTMEKEKSLTELEFLKAQFNPHFLFNSINSIYGHIDRNNTTARQMLLTFSDMLRYQLYECNSEVIPIDKELNYIRNYITLQQSRNGDGLRICLEIGDCVSGFTIVPLLFIAFIENSFKYVSHHERKENRVDISFNKRDTGLHFRVFNTTEPRARIEHQGIGITNARRRLELLYPDNYELCIREQESDYEVNLILQVP